MKVYVIRHTVRPVEYWTGAGWGKLESALAYSEAERNSVRLPLAGEWVLLPGLDS